MVHTSDFRRRRAVSPQPPPHGYSPPIIRPYHHRMYQRPKDGTHEAPSSLSFDRRRRWLFVHQISLTVATTMPQWWEFSSHYNRHIPSNVSSAEQGILMKLRPLSSIVVSVVRSAADNDCLASSTSPPTADRRLRWVYNRKDAGMLIVRLHLTLTPTSLNLYTARQGYNHRRSISR